MFKPLESTRGLADRLRGLYFHWKGTHRNGLPPSLDRVGLHRIAFGLDCLVVTEVLRGPEGAPQDFEYVYIGRTLNGALHREQTGHRLSQHPHKLPGSQIWEAYMAIAHNPCPHVVDLPYIGPDPRYACTEELFLPLCDDHGTLRYVMVGVELRAVGHPACLQHPPPESAPDRLHPGTGGD